METDQFALDFLQVARVGSATVQFPERIPPASCAYRAETFRRRSCARNGLPNQPDASHTLATAVASSE